MHIYSNDLDKEKAQNETSKAWGIKHLQTWRENYPFISRYDRDRCAFLFETSIGDTPIGQGSRHHQNAIVPTHLAARSRAAGSGCASAGLAPYGRRAALESTIILRPDVVVSEHGDASCKKMSTKIIGQRNDGH